MTILELRSPHVDSAPLIKIRASYVPPVGSVIEVLISDVDLGAFEADDTELLRARSIWQWRVVAVRFPVSGSRADRVVVHVVPVIVGNE